jgi:phage-related protein
MARAHSGSSSSAARTPALSLGRDTGPGIFELVEDHDGNTYRVVYTVRFKVVVYVLHAFQKKSPKGIKTAKTDVDLIARRLRAARQDYEDHHAKAKR